jgi:fibronectin-binding autotransporter adhesin
MKLILPEPHLRGARGAQLKTSTAILTLGGLAVASILVSTGTFAATKRSVCPSGCTYPTVQSAIDAAVNDDTILIGKGRYVENLNTEGKKITLQGSGRGGVILDGNGKGTVIDIPGKKLVVVSDVTITRGFGDGGGILVHENADLNLRHSIVTSNHSTVTGGAIRVSTDNLAGNLTIVDCLITNNDAAEGGGGVAGDLQRSKIDIRDSTFARNSGGPGAGGAIGFFGLGAQISIDHTDFSGNMAAMGGGILIDTHTIHSELRLTNSNIVDNVATGKHGGGLFFRGGLFSSSHNIIAHNATAADGGGIYFGAGFATLTSAAFTDTWIIMNKAGGTGGGVGTDTPIDLSGAVITDNTPDNCPASQGSCP